jgi:hypothetical protein
MFLKDMVFEGETKNLHFAIFQKISFFKLIYS